MLLKCSVILAIVVVVRVSGKHPHGPRGSHIIKRENRKQEFSEHLNHQDKE